MNRNERLKAAYDYLYSIGKVHAITEFANVIGAARTSVSKAYNGDPNYVKGTILVKVAAAFPDVFNREWLVDGVGEMLAEKAPAKEVNQPLDVNMIIQHLIRNYDDVQSELREVRQELRDLRAEVEKLQRVHTGYGSSIAAEDAQHYGIKEVK